MSQKEVANCFSCKETVDVLNPERKVTTNGRLRLTGECSQCHKKVSRFVSDPEKPALSTEEKKARESARRELKKKEKELHPELQSAISKKGKKRRIIIGNIEVNISAQELTDENQPKRRKLTAKEKREKEIKALKEENERIKQLLSQKENEVENENDDSSGNADTEESENDNDSE